MRDCLEVLRYGGGLELGARVRRSKTERWKYIYKEESAKNLTASLPSVKPFAVKAPNVIDLMDELPKTSTGKLRKNVLREWARGNKEFSG